MDISQNIAEPKKTQSKKRLAVIAAIGLILIGGALAYRFVLSKLDVVQQIKGRKTIASVMKMYGEAAHKRLNEKFKKANVVYPPKKLTMLGLKSERALEIYASGDDKKQMFVFSYPIIGNSGVLGPKLREGDYQMPEGFYRIQELEPNSLYHVALRVNYPSEFDLEKAKIEGRTHPGCDIMIHGSNGSIGCLAMGDPASEEIFALVHDVGIENTELLMCPYDFRNPPKGVELPTTPEWITALYADLEKQLKVFPTHSSN